MRIWMHPYLPRRNLRIVIHRWGSLSCAWRPTDSELHRWPVDPTSGNVKLLLPPRQSRGNSHYGLVVLSIPTVAGRNRPVGNDSWQPAADLLFLKLSLRPREVRIRHKDRLWSIPKSKPRTSVTE